MKYFDNIYCLSIFGCQESNGISYSNTVWYYGPNVAENKMTSVIYGNVYCGGTKACFNTKIEYVYGDIGIIAKGNQVLQESTIEHISNDVYAVGSSAMYQSTAKNISHVCSICIAIKSHDTLLLVFVSKLKTFCACER